MERRLAAVLIADVVGYSHLMEVDEEGTLRRLRGDLHDLVGAAGFEPATPRPPVWCATRLRYAPPESRD